MTSVKLKFRASAIQGKAGVLYYRLIKKRVVRQIKTDYLIYEWEWDEQDETFVKYDKNYPRQSELDTIQSSINEDLARLKGIIAHMNASKKDCTTDEVVAAFIAGKRNGCTVFAYIKQRIEHLKAIGRITSANHTTSTLQRLREYRSDKDLSFSDLTSCLIELFEAHLKKRGLKRNTTSFYMRQLRSIYRQAVEDGLASESDIFKHVYTSVDKTAKRAITKKDMRRIICMDLNAYPKLLLARDIFLFSFYTYGMSFIDMAFLKKSDLRNNLLTYRRHKTGQEISFRWMPEMQEIVSR